MVNSGSFKKGNKPVAPFKKGHTAWNKGKKMSDEYRKNLSEAHRGILLSKETKKKISIALKGRKKPLFSAECRKKMSKAKRGQPAWNKGIPLGFTPKSAFEEGCVPWNKGMKGLKHSEETKKKISRSSKGIHPKSYYQKIGTMSVIKQQSSKGPTSIEKKLYNELKSRGLLFEKQKLINGRFVVDAWIPSLNLIIEADGDYWHSLPRAKKRDKSRNAYLTKCGYNLLRLTETEINNGGFRRKLPNA